MLAASAALEISNIPFKGPIAGVRVGRVDGAFVCNPTCDAGKSDLNLFLVGRKIVPGTEGKPYDVNLVMLEGGAKELGEEDIVEAINLRPGVDAARHRASGRDAEGHREGQAGLHAARHRRGPLSEDFRPGDGRVQRGLRDLGEARPLRQARRDVREKAVETLCRKIRRSSPSSSTSSRRSTAASSGR